jgi:hypothetical protein
VATIVCALAIAVIGAMLVIDQWATAADRSRSTDATLAGLTAQVGAAGWSSADHVMPIPAPNGAPGYQMPPQMMPGMPTGDDARLSVPLTLRNTTGAGLEFDVATEFLLHGGRETESRTPHSDTFGELNRLGPGSAVDGVVYFNAKAPGPDDPPLYLEWTRDGQIAQLTIQLDGSAPPAHHDQ